MGRSAQDAHDFAVISDDGDSELPKPVRASHGVSGPVQQLMDCISDKKVHRIENATPTNKARWGRKLRYAAKKANKDVVVIYVPENNPDEKPPGIWFQGFEKGDAPKRGQRK